MGAKELSADLPRIQLQITTDTVVYQVCRPVPEANGSQPGMEGKSISHTSACNRPLNAISSWRASSFAPAKYAAKANVSMQTP